MLDREQQSEYLAKLGLDAVPRPTKETLDELIYAHQTNIPFSTMKVDIDSDAPCLDSDHLFDKVIIKGHGGYCFELNKLFQDLLISLGYAARPALSRAVRGRAGRMPINHRGILVAFDEGLFSADVGFGGPMPAGALRLALGEKREVLGETYLVDPIDHAWWKIDRITKAEQDLHDDALPVRRQTELEICTAAVEDIDFAAMNLSCFRPGTLFHDHDLLNLRTKDGHKAYRDGVLTIREHGQKQIIELSDEDEKREALAEHFGFFF